MVRALLAPSMVSPHEGAKTPIYLASSPEVGGNSGKYFLKNVPTQSSPLSYDEGLARRLWDVSARLTGLEGAEPLPVSENQRREIDALPVVP